MVKMWSQERARNCIGPGRNGTKAFLVKVRSRARAISTDRSLWHRGHVCLKVGCEQEHHRPPGIYGMKAIFGQGMVTGKAEHGHFGQGVFASKA